MTTAYRSLALTLAAMVAYWMAARLPNPFLSAEAMQAIYENGFFTSERASGFGPFVLGLGPALSGFFLVEVLSFFLPPLSRWRKEGWAGRSRLNLMSLGFTIFLALVTATFIVRQMQGISSGTTGLMDGTLASSLGSGAFFVSGFALLFMLATLLTPYGLGNGFGLILLAGAIARLWESVRYWLLSKAEVASAGLMDRVTPVLLSLLLVGLFYLWISRKRAITVEKAGRMLSFELSPLMQGFFAWSLAWQFTSLMHSLDLLLQFKLNLKLDHSSAFTRYGLFLSFFALFSVLFYWMAFSSRRILNNTAGQITIPSLEKVRLGKLALAAFAGVALFELARHLPHPLVSSESMLAQAFDFGSLVAVYVFGKDIWQNFVFLRSVKDPVCLGELDNIHLAALARAEGEAAGEIVYLKGFEYRRLLSFFQPLQKVRVYTSAGFASALRERLQLDSVPTV